MFDEQKKDEFNIDQDIKQTVLAQAGTVLPTTLPVIHLNNAQVFPGLVAPIILPSGSLVKAVDIAMTQTKNVALIMAKSSSKTPSIKDLYSIGVTAKILKKINLSDGGTSVLLQGVKRFRVVQFIKDSPFIVAKVEHLEDIVTKDIELDALSRSVRSIVKISSRCSTFATMNGESFMN